MTPFKDDVTDAITHMLWVEVSDVESYELAQDVLDALRTTGIVVRSDGSTVNMRVRDLLVDALLPENIAGNLDFGITARTILDHALWTGLDLRVLQDKLEAWDMAHHFM